LLGISRNTVRAALASDGPPKYERKPAGSAVDAFEPRIRELLQAYPMMPATVIAERVGWERGLTVLKDRVRELRPAYLPPDPASRTAYEPGELAQCDFWFPPVTVPAGFGQERGATRLPVLTMVSGYSRWLSAVLVPSRHAQDLFAGWWPAAALDYLVDAACGHRGAAVHREPHLGTVCLSVPGADTDVSANATGGTEADLERPPDHAAGADLPVPQVDVTALRVGRVVPMPTSSDSRIPVGLNTPSSPCRGAVSPPGSLIPARAFRFIVG